MGGVWFSRATRSGACVLPAPRPSCISALRADGPRAGASYSPPSPSLAAIATPSPRAVLALPKNSSSLQQANVLADATMPRPIRDSSLMKPPNGEGFPIQVSRRGFELGGCLRIRTNDDDSAGLTPRPPATDRALRKRPCAPDTLRRRMCCCWRRVRARPVPFDRHVISVRTACYGERADRIRDTFLR